jgi:hypothetical protein
MVLSICYPPTLWGGVPSDAAVSQVEGTTQPAVSLSVATSGVVRENDCPISMRGTHSGWALLRRLLSWSMEMLRFLLRLLKPTALFGNE